MENKKTEIPGYTQNSFVFGIIGTPGSGKSTLIEQLIYREDLYFRKFNRVLYITPSKFDNIKLVEGANWYRNISIPWIQEKIKELDELKTKIKLLIVLDDCVSELSSYAKDQALISLIYNRRHITENINLSWIIVSQKYNLIPLSIRTMFTGLFLFRLPKTQIEDVFKDVIIPNSKGLRRSLDALWGNKHDFIFINNDNYKIFHNFQLLFI